MSIRVPYSTCPIPKLQKANLEYWLKMEYWFLSEAIFLLLGYEPPQNDKERERILYPGFYLDEKSQKLQKLYKIARRKAWPGPPNPWPLSIQLPPIIFLEWAQSIGHPIPVEFNILLTNTSKNKNEIKPLQKDTFGQESANKRWASHNEIMDMAILVAEEKWKSGDRDYHNKMATKLLELKQFESIKDNKNALMKRLVPIAKKYNLVRGVKGSFGAE